MARPWRIRYAGAKYHVTVRGNARQTVFHSVQDYRKFLEQLEDALNKDSVALYAYALMPNHYHLLIETPHGNVQRFMQKLNTAYSMYHRHRHSAPGHCFQGRYGAKLVEGNEYILRLTRYIHLNPIKVKRLKNADLETKLSKLNKYKWSSYRGYSGTGPVEDIVDYSYLRLMGRKTAKGNRNQYRRYIAQVVSRDDKELTEALTASRYAIGDSKFIDRIEKALNAARENKGVYGDLMWPEGKVVSISEIQAAVAKEFKVSEEDLTGRSYGARQAKKAAIELACRYSNMSQRAVGEHFGYKGNGSTRKQRERFREIAETDARFSKKVKQLEGRLSKS